MLAHRILIFGAGGQVGWELSHTLSCLGQVTAVDRPEVELTNPDAIRRTVRSVKPAIVINAAAYTAVDKAEAEPQVAMAINGVAPAIIAEETKRLNGVLVHYSTDYVFDGTKPNAYTEEDEPAPLNVYGRTKLAGDEAVESVGGKYIVFRTSWVYGPRGRNFLLTMLRLARERRELRIVNDQVGAPTPSPTIAQVTVAALAQLVAHPGLDLDGRSGVYNLTTSGETSWYGFADAILTNTALNPQPVDCRLVPITSREYQTPAKRPANSRLSGQKLAEAFSLSLPTWREGLARTIDRITERVEPVRLFKAA